MTKILKMLIVSSIAASFAVPCAVNAADNVLCSVAVIGSAPVQKSNFVIPANSDVVFGFGNSIFNELIASTQTANGVTTVTVDYFADVDIFDSIEFSTTLTLPSGHDIASSKGRAGFSSRTSSGDASYAVNCRRQ